MKPNGDFSFQWSQKSISLQLESGRKLFILWYFFLFRVSRRENKGASFFKMNASVKGSMGQTVALFSFSPGRLRFQSGLQMSGGTVEKWIVRFDLGISPGGFTASGAGAVVRWAHRRRLLCPACFGCRHAPLLAQAVSFPLSCWVRRCCVIVSFPS